MKLRVFDNPSFFDRYTVVWIDGTSGPFAYIGMSSDPLDRNALVYANAITAEWMEANLEREILYEALPENCRRYIEMEIREWPSTTQ